MSAGLRFGYGTNGFADHRLADVIELLADLGYDGVALTLDHQHLDPFDVRLAKRVATVRRQLERTGLAVVVETGARYLLDPRRKHQPTLLGDDRDRRIDLLFRAVAVARDLGSEVMSFWSGGLPVDVSPAVAWARLVDGCHEVLDRAAAAGVQAAFEPEPGMLVDTLDGYDRLVADLGGRPLWLTLDIGHCRCLEPEPVAECIRRSASRLVNVQVDDMRRGVHEHLELGSGEVDLPAALRALAQVGYTGLASVELPRHSHAAPEVARTSLARLRAAQVDGYRRGVGAHAGASR